MAGYLRLAAAVLLITATAGCTGAQDSPQPSAAPSGTVSATPSTTPSTPPGDCAEPPPQSAFVIGGEDPCFLAMSQRFVPWLAGNTLPDGEASQPSTQFTADTAANIENIQRIMGDEADGWLGPTQWTRLLTQDPPATTQLRASGIGPLWFGMTGAQLDASGHGRAVAASDAPPTAEVFGSDAVGCYDGETFYAAYTKGPSDVATVEGITTRSTVADLQRVFGSQLRTYAPPQFGGFTAYTVLQEPFGYAFIPQPDGALMIIAGDSREVDSARTGPHGICGN